MSRSEIEEILTKHKTVAVVGLSREPDKDSHRVSAYLKAHGFRIIPVNPFADEILGEKSYKSLLDIPPEIRPIGIILSSEYDTALQPPLQQANRTWRRPE